MSLFSGTIPAASDSAMGSKPVQMQLYGGEPASDCIQFITGCMSELATHQFAGGGQVQPAVLLARIKGCVSASSGLTKPLETLMLTIASTYLRDARAGTFTITNLIRLHPEVLRSFQQQYRGPPITAEGLEQQVLNRLGCVQGSRELKTYTPGKPNQPPKPVQPAATNAAPSSSGGTAFQRQQLSSVQNSIGTAQQDLEAAEAQEQRAASKLHAARASSKSLRQLDQELLEEVAAAVEQLLFPDGLSPSDASESESPRGGNSASATHFSPVVTRQRAAAAAALAAKAVADGGGTESDESAESDDEHADVVPPAVPRARTSPLTLQDEWRALLQLPQCLTIIHRCVKDLLSEVPVDTFMRRYLPHLPAEWDKADAATALRVFAYDLCIMEDGLEAASSRILKLKARYTRYSNALAEVRERRDRLYQKEEQLQAIVGLSNLSSSGAATASVGGETFQAYAHPKHPELLVNPGALVVLLLLELIRLRCAYLPGANSLRNNPPLQQYGKESLAQYGQLFRDAAEMRGQDDTPNLHVQLYLHGLSDTALRDRYLRSLMKDATQAPSSLESVIAQVETMANAELRVLGNAAEVGGVDAQRKFREKQTHVCPSAVSNIAVGGKAAGKAAPAARLTGEVTSSWVSSLFPSSKGSEQALLEAPCVIHTAFGGAVPHKLADCSFAKKLAAMPLAQAKQTLCEYQANRLARNLPTASVAEWGDVGEVEVTQGGFTGGDDDGSSALSSAFASMHCSTSYPTDDPDVMIGAYMALGTLTAGAHGITEAVAAAALGTGNTQYTRSPTVQAAYEQARDSAQVPTGPMPVPELKAPCPYCNRSQGHGSSICFAQHPDCAPPFYKGPLLADGPMAEKTFLQRVPLCRPHSRYKEAVVQGLFPKSAGSRPPATRQPPTRLLHRPASNIRAAAATTIDGCVAAVLEDQWVEEGYEEEEVAGYACMAAHPVGFPVIDAAQHASNVQPKPGPQHLPVDGAVISSQLQQALDSGDAAQQLFAVTQGVQTMVAGFQQLDARVQEQGQRLGTYEQLLSSHWRVTLPASPGPKEGEDTSRQVVASTESTVPAPAVVACLAESLQESDRAELIDLSPMPPQDLAGLQTWTQQQLHLALHRHSGVFIMDQPRYQEPERGLLVVTPLGEHVTDLDIRLDSGCTIDIITKAAAETAGIPWYSAAGQLGIRLANGGSAPLVGVTSTFNVMVQQGSGYQLTTVVRALVLAGDESSQPGYDLLLGKGWMANHKVDLQPARQRIVYTTDTGRQAHMPLMTRLSVHAQSPATSAMTICDAMVVNPPVTVSASSSQQPSSVVVPIPIPGCDPSGSPSASVFAATASSEANVSQGPGASPLSSPARRSVPIPRPVLMPVPVPVQVPISAAPCQASVQGSASDDESSSGPLSCENHAAVVTATVSMTAGVCTATSTPAVMAANGTVPGDLLPNTCRAAPSSANSRLSWHAQQFNPMQDLAPQAQVPLNPDELPELLEDEEWGWHYGSNLELQQRQQLREMLADNLGVFAFRSEDLVGYTGSAGGFAGVELELTPGTTRVYESERRYSPQHMAIQDEKCAEMQALGWIAEVPTTTQFASNSTCPGKKDVEGNWTERRFCIDFRPLNTHTVPDAYRMPLPEDLFSSLGEPSHLTTLDLRSGFHQLPMHPDSVPLTAFWWRRRLYAYRRMPFGLRNATAVFQRVVDSELERAGLTDCAKVFVDDIIIHSSSFAEHLQHVAAVLQCLQRAGLRVHPRKSTFRYH